MDPDERSGGFGFGRLAIAGRRGFLDRDLNQFLPNLPAVHLFRMPSGTRGVAVGARGRSRGTVEWAPARSRRGNDGCVRCEREQNLKSALSQVLKHSVTSIAAAEDYIYAGDSEGRLAGFRRCRRELGRDIQTGRAGARWKRSGWTRTIHGWQ